MECQRWQHPLHLCAQRQFVQRDDWVDHPTERRQPPVQADLAQQHVDDLLVQLEIVGQQRRLDLVRVGDQVQQAVSDEWRVGRKVRSPRQLGLRRRTQ